MTRADGYQVDPPVSGATVLPAAVDTVLMLSVLPVALEASEDLLELLEDAIFVGFGASGSGVPRSAQWPFTSSSKSAKRFSKAWGTAGML